VILLPEIPYDVEKVAEAIRQRSRAGKHFSVVAVAEGTMSLRDAKDFRAADQAKQEARTKMERKKARNAMLDFHLRHDGNTLRLAKELEHLTGLESRVTILGYVQRGGSPSAVDRLLATRLGTACADLINEGRYGVMVAARGDKTEPVPLEKVAGKRKTVPLDHAWITSARLVGTSLGD
jgi:6-phosphofructokinase 1